MISINVHVDFAKEITHESLPSSEVVYIKTEDSHVALFLHEDPKVAQQIADLLNQARGEKES